MAACNIWFGPRTKPAIEAAETWAEWEYSTLELALQEEYYREGALAQQEPFEW